MRNRTILTAGIAFFLVGIAMWTGMNAFLDGKNHFARIDARDREEDRAFFEWLEARGYRVAEGGRTVPWSTIGNETLIGIEIEKSDPSPRVRLETENATYDLVAPDGIFRPDDLDRIEKDTRRKDGLFERKLNALMDRTIAGLVGITGLIFALLLYRLEFEFHADDSDVQSKNGREEYVVFVD